MLQGTILKESLSDELVLDLVDMVHVEMWRVENRADFQPMYWTAISFESESPLFLDRLSKGLKEKWYVDLTDGEDKILVFKDRIIRYALGDASGREQAASYCREIGIPESQIDWPE